jgi:hypothetical protein
VWLVGWALWPLAALMVLRAVPSAVGDVQQLVTGVATPHDRMDLVLWSPLFLIWGLLWAATALTYARRTKTARAKHRWRRVFVPQQGTRPGLTARSNPARCGDWRGRAARETRNKRAMSDLYPRESLTWGGSV